MFLIQCNIKNHSSSCYEKDKVNHYRNVKEAVKILNKSFRTYLYNFIAIAI